ncbi:MAG: leucine-rich repeat domain-containing protein [Roseburia sp.]|nr:leucine-rich repeat domain-containing protein [Roseburia sp.]MCM1430227.1 leucine-rich repeat domain-containing protein [Muribaculaceae bacterium]
MKRFVKSFGMAAFFLLALLFFRTDAKAATAPHIVGQEEVIYLDGRDKIAVLGDNIISVTYSSDKKTVATVSKDGVVKPKKKGKATIRAKVTYKKNGKKTTKTLKYQVQVLGKSTEYFVYTKTNRILRLKDKAKKLESLYIPGYNAKGKITAMYGGSLAYNENLKYLYVSDNLETFVPHVEDIYPHSLMHCPNLKSVHLGKNYGYLQYMYNCPSIEHITVDERNKNYKVVDDVYFSKDGKNLCYYPAGKRDAAYVIPEGTERVYGYAFYGARYLQSVTLPETVKSLGEGAFYAGSLQEVHMPEYAAINMEEGYVFAECRNLKSLRLPEGVTSIYRMCCNCTALESVELPASFSASWWLSSAFTGCSSLKNIQLNGGCEACRVIDGVVFSMDGRELYLYPAGKTDIASYTVPDGTEVIWEYAFYDASCTEVRIPASVKIEEDAFRKDTDIKIIQ